ncbi:unnamed protein product [Protopolystoma xenopodis]|uniref:Uncharacterized protein n=1 Tax=Protopolystoma xenopodis TaxID=117903 RepID=A0A3S5CV13_9PLAT|nr:unnamed protein product [Protopolystoma xenopodis]
MNVSSKASCASSSTVNAFCPSSYRSTEDSAISPRFPDDVSCINIRPMVQARSSPKISRLLTVDLNDSFSQSQSMELQSVPVIGTGGDALFGFPREQRSNNVSANLGTDFFTLSTSCTNLEEPV